jgi:hypothetical protein
MRILIFGKSNDLSQSFASLLQVIKADKEIRNRVIQLLKANSYTRRMLLNKWLEQLWRKQASDNLMQALSCLFDDSIAEKVLVLFDSQHIKVCENKRI